MNNSTYPNNPQEAIFVPAQKCPYHVTFDLDLDLEQTLDARLPGVHRVQVWWRSGHLPARSDGQCKFSTCAHVHCGQTDCNTSLPRAGEVVNKLLSLSSYKYTVIKNNQWFFISVQWQYSFYCLLQWKMQKIVDNSTSICSWQTNTFVVKIDGSAT